MTGDRKNETAEPLQNEKTSSSSDSEEEDDNLDYYLSIQPAQTTRRGLLPSSGSRTRRPSSIQRNLLLKTKKFFAEEDGYNIRAKPELRELVELYERILLLVLTRKDRVGLDRSELNLANLKSNSIDRLCSSHILKYMKSALNMSDQHYSQCVEKLAPTAESKSIKVTICGAKGLKAKNGKSSSPYVTVCLGETVVFEDDKSPPKTVMIKKTKAVENNLSPSFGDTLEFNIDLLTDLEKKEKGNITVMLWTKTDGGKKIKFLGLAMFNVNDIFSNSGIFQKSFALQKRSSRSHVTGSIDIIAEYQVSRGANAVSCLEKDKENISTNRRLYGFLLDALFGFENDNNPKFDMDLWDGQLKQQESLWVLKEYEKSISLGKIDKTIYLLSRMVFQFCMFKVPGNHLYVLKRFSDTVVPTLRYIEEHLGEEKLYNSDCYAFEVMQPMLEYVYTVAKSAIRNFRDIFILIDDSSKEQWGAEFKGCLEVVESVHNLMRPDWHCFNVNSQFMTCSEVLMSLFSESLELFFDSLVVELTESLNAADKPGVEMGDSKPDNISIYIANLNQAAVKDLETVLPPYDDVLSDTTLDVSVILLATEVYYRAIMEKVELLVKLNICDMSVTISADSFELYRNIKAVKQMYIKMLKKALEPDDSLELDDDETYLTMMEVLNMFEPVLSQWIECVSLKSIEWVQRAVDEDCYEPVTDTALHSSAVVDIFGSFTQCVEYVDKLQWHNKKTLHSSHEPRLASIICDAVLKYAVFLGEKFGVVGNIGYYEEDGFTVSREFCVALNNLVQSFDELNSLREIMQFSAKENDLFTEVYRRMDESLETLIGKLADALEPQFIEHITYILDQKLGRAPPQKVKVQSNANPSRPPRPMERRLSDNSALKHIIEENERRSVERAGKSKRYDKIVKARKKKAEIEARKAESNKKETVKFTKFIKKNWNKLKDGKTIETHVDENKVLIAIDPFLQFFNSILSIFAENLYPDVLKRVLIESWKRLVITVGIWLEVVNRILLYLEITVHTALIAIILVPGMLERSSLKK